MSCGDLSVYYRESSVDSRPNTTSDFIRVFYRSRLGRCLCQRPAFLTCPPLFVIFKGIYSFLNLGPQVCTVKSGFVDNFMAVCAVPPQPIKRALRPGLLQNDADCIGKSDGIVRGVGRQEKHLTFADCDVFEPAFINHFEDHRAAILIEPFRGFVDMIVCSGIWAADDLFQIKTGLPRVDV